MYRILSTLGALTPRGTACGLSESLTAGGASIVRKRMRSKSSSSRRASFRQHSLSTSMSTKDTAIDFRARGSTRQKGWRKRTMPREEKDGLERSLTPRSRLQDRLLRQPACSRTVRVEKERRTGLALARSTAAAAVLLGAAGGAGGLGRSARSGSAAALALRASRCPSAGSHAATRLPSPRVSRRRGGEGHGEDEADAPTPPLRSPSWPGSPSRCRRTRTSRPWRRRTSRGRCRRPEPTGRERRRLRGRGERGVGQLSVRDRQLRRL